MARGRFLSRSIAEDQALASLSLESELLFLHAVPHLDRDGLITGQPLVLLGQVAPLRIPQLATKAAELVREWVDAGLAILYLDGKRPVLFFPGFLKNQRLRYDREAPSEYAPPPGYARTGEGLVPAQLLEPEEELVQQPEQPAEEVPEADSGPTPELVRSNSGVTPPYKQQRIQESKNPRLSVPYATAATTRAHARARPSSTAAAAAAAVVAAAADQEILTLLQAFGIQGNPARELAQSELDPKLVEAWIQYAEVQEGLTNPAGYVVERLRAGDKPPKTAMAGGADDYEALKRKWVPDGWEDIIKH